MGLTLQLDVKDLAQDVDGLPKRDHRPHWNMGGCKTLPTWWFAQHVVGSTDLDGSQRRSSRRGDGEGAQSGGEYAMPEGAFSDSLTSISTSSSTCRRAQCAGLEWRQVDTRALLA